MKLRKLMAVGMTLMAFTAFADQHQGQNVNSDAKMNPAASKTTLKTEKDRLSYTIGVDIGENLGAQSLDIDEKVLIQGLNDGLNKGDLLMTREEMQKTIMDLQKRLVAEQKAKMEAAGSENAKKGKEFLAKNKQAKGVVALPSGLQYKVIDNGDGPSPSQNDFVTVDYEGKLINGEVFDSSYKRGKPVQFKVSQVIQGWQEALQKMKKGATWELYIPPELAYGERGLGGPIGPNETLVFKVHLISIDQEGSKKN